MVFGFSLVGGLGRVEGCFCLVGFVFSFLMVGFGFCLFGFIYYLVSCLVCFFFNKDYTDSIMELSEILFLSGESGALPWPKMTNHSLLSGIRLPDYHQHYLVLVSAQSS